MFHKYLGIELLFGRRERVCQTIGDDAKANISQDEFVNQTMEKHCAPRDIEKVVDWLFDLKQGKADPGAMCKRIF